MIKLKMKHCNTILTEKQEKYQHYHQIKSINMYFLQSNFLPCDQIRIMEQDRFAYSLLSIAFQKQIKTIKDQKIKQVEN